MPPARLIILEGLPGSGKSTTAQQVWLRLEAQGRPARWWFEHELEHPIFDDEAVRRARRGEPGAAAPLFAQALEGWAALARRLQAIEETVVLEGTVFQTAVGTQLLVDAPRAEIAAHFRRMAEIIAPLAPALVRLGPPDAAAALRRACDRRQPWFETFLLEAFAASPRGRRLAPTSWSQVEDYFAEREALADLLAEEWPGPRLRHDNGDGDWARQRNVVGAFLGLPPAPAASPAAPPADYTGRYRAATGDEWLVAADAGGLYLADDARPRLLPRGGDAFVIEGLCVELAFERTGAGPIGAIRCRGALPGLAPHWARVSANGP